MAQEVVGGFTMVLLCDTVPWGLWEDCPLGKFLFLPGSHCFEAFLFHIKIDLWGSLCDVDIGFLCLYNVFG